MKAKVSHLDISRTICAGMPFDFSSDSSPGRRPTSKFEEKSKGIPIALEIVWCEQLFTAEKVLHLFGASLRGGNRGHRYGPEVAGIRTYTGVKKGLMV
jgi:hypothetical protein